MGGGSIFEPQLDATEAQRFTGTICPGSICAEAIRRRHGGAPWLRPRPGAVAEAGRRQGIDIGINRMVTSTILTTRHGGWAFRPRIVTMRGLVNCSALPDKGGPMAKPKTKLQVWLRFLKWEAITVSVCLKRRGIGGGVHQYAPVQPPRKCVWTVDEADCYNTSCGNECWHAPLTNWTHCPTAAARSRRSAMTNTKQCR